MAAETFVALVNAHSRGRSVIKIAEDAGLPPHRIQRFMRPSFELTRMPTQERIEEIARALDADPEEVRRAFVTDLIRTTPTPEEIDRREREMLRLYQRLPAPYQDTLMQVARSLSHLARAVSQDDGPESGEGRSAV